MSDSGAFFGQAKTKYYEWLDQVADEVFLSLRLAAVSEKDFLPKLRAGLESKESLDVLKYLGKIPEEHYAKFSPKMRGEFSKYGKMVFRGDYIVSVAMRKFDDDHWWKEYQSIQNLQLPERAKYYLSECVKSYLVGAFDGCIVMGGRATEFSIKESLRRRGTSFNDKDALHEVWSKFKGVFSPKAQMDTNVLDEIEELVRVYRNVTAHDSSKTATEEEAELVFNSAKLCCNLLLASP